MLKIGGSLREMAWCLHRCVAAFTCQLLVEVVSSLMICGADSDMPASPFSGPAEKATTRERTQA